MNADDNRPLKIAEEIVYYLGEPLTMGKFRTMTHQQKNALLQAIPVQIRNRRDAGDFKKRHYEAIASVLKECSAQMDTLGIHNRLKAEIVELLTARFALMLAHDNPAFDSFRFKDAVMKPPVGAARRGKADGANSTRAKITAR